MDKEIIMVNRVGLEDIELIKIMDWVRYNKLHNFTWHCANERQCSPQAGALLKRKGVLAGVSDLFLAKSSGAWHGLFIELKVKGGKLSPAQSKFLEAMNSNGYLAVCRFGADEAIKTIKEYLLLE
jgi:hypothetical protein